MKDINNKIICGDVTKVLRKFPSDSIDCVITSPPYWALRDYGLKPEVWDGDIACDHEWIDEKKIINIGSSSKSTLRNGKERKQTEKYAAASKETETNFCLKCGAWSGSLGLEPTFDLFIKHLCDIFDEVKRVLKERGTCWVNLGDTYSGGGNTNDRFQKKGRSKSVGEYKFNYKLNRIQEKCLCLIPFRFAIEMINRGWILRNTIIWHKPNCMPSSVKDRFTADFEYLFFFTKSKKYWFEMQYEALKQPSIERLKHNFYYNKGDIASAVKTSGIKRFQERFFNNEVFGRNKRCVWAITTRPYKEAHFAVFPPQLVETPIRAGCPEFVCKECGKPRKRILEPSEEYKKLLNQSWTEDTDKSKKLRAKIEFQANTKKVACTQDYRFIGYADCKCNAGWNNGIVLDPFSGSGTTLSMAKSLGRNYIGIDLNPEYIKMAERRIAKLDKDEERKTHGHIS